MNLLLSRHYCIFRVSDVLTILVACLAAGSAADVVIGKSDLLRVSRIIE